MKDLIGDMESSSDESDVADVSKKPQGVWGTFQPFFLPKKGPPKTYQNHMLKKNSAACAVPVPGTQEKNR